MKRRTIKPLGMEHRKPITIPVNTDERPDANFTGTLDEWDDRVFNHAVKFRIHRFVKGARETTEVTDFAYAMRIAIEQIHNGHRVLVYAVTESGRYQALEPKKWNHYAGLYLARRAKPLQ